MKRQKTMKRQIVAGLSGLVLAASQVLSTGCPQGPKKPVCPVVSVVSGPVDYRGSPGEIIDREVEAHDPDGKIKEYNVELIPFSGAKPSAKLLICPENEALLFNGVTYPLNGDGNVNPFGNSSLEWVRGENEELSLRVTAGEGNVRYTLGTIGDLRQGYFGIRAQYLSEGRASLEIYVRDNAGNSSKIQRIDDFISGAQLIPIPSEGEGEGEGESEGEGEGEGEGEQTCREFSGLQEAVINSIPRAVDNPETPINEGNFIELYNVGRNEDGSITYTPFRRVMPNTQYPIHHLVPAGIQDGEIVAVAGYGLGEIESMYSGAGGYTSPLDMSYLFLNRNGENPCSERVGLRQSQFTIEASGRNGVIGDVVQVSERYPAVNQEIEEQGFYMN